MRTFTESYTYGNATWGDLLTKYNGTNITYDAIGNPLKWRNASTIEWRGRRLELLESTSGKVFDYTYNSDGIRTQKKIYSVGGVLESTVNYILDGSKIIAENHGGIMIYYAYDESGTIMGMMYNNQLYTFRKNLQGDVTGIYNANGELVAEYRYSPYGEILAITNGNGVNVSTNTSHIANINPFRYRGYYYDTETGFYWLSSRYYDPEVGRFINADGYVSTGQGIIGHNMFAYCGNNPIVRIDADGTSWKSILKFALHVGNTILVALGYDTAAFGASFLNMSKDSSGVYHADFNCWQQYFGYNSFYDWMFDAGTSMKSAKFSFVYNGSGYTIWAWKGDYINLGAGAELGIYRGNSGHRTVDKSLAMQMSMTLKYKGKTIISYYPSERQWWITGFNPKYLNVSASDLTATFTLRFNSSGMFNAFRSKYSWDSRWRFYTNGYYATFQF